MPVTYSGASGAVALLNRALKNTSESKATFDTQLTDAAAALAAGADATQILSYTAYADTLAAAITPAKTAAEWSLAILTNMGVLPSTVAEVTALEGALTAYIGANGGVARIGTIALQLGAVIGSLETATGNQAVYNAAAVAFNTEVANSVAYSGNAASTTSTTENIAAPSVSLTLTAAAETVTGGASNDVITGVVSALSSERTLNDADSIDGGAGNDTLNVTLKSAFTGFNSTTGALKNVETVVLTNDSTIARDFNAKGIAGVTAYTLNAKTGTISLTDLGEAGQTITVNEQAGTSNLNIGFQSASAVVTGTATDAVSLTLNKVGTAETKAGAADQKYMTVNMASIEALTVNSTGTQDNFVNLSGVTAAKSLSVTGSANLDVAAVAGTIATVDASKATGKVTADLTAATAITSVSTGTGDDSVTLDVSKVQANATVAGGTGADKVVFKAGGATTLQLAMTGVETIELGAVTGTLTYSAKNTTGLTTVDVASTANQDATFATMGTGDLTVNLKGANATNKAVSTDGSGAVTVNTAATATAVTDKTGQVNVYDVTATKATKVAVNVGAFTTYNGDIIAASATEVSVKAGSSLNDAKAEQSGFGGTVTAAKATSFSVESLGTIGGTVTTAAATSGTVTTGATAGALAIVAAKLESLTVTAANALDLDTGATLTGLQVLNATTSKGKLDFGNLAAASTITVGGAGTTSQADFGNLGSGTLDYGVTLTATGLKGGLAIGTMTSNAGNITVNAAATTGAVTQTGAVSGKAVSFDVNGATGAVKIADTAGVTGDSVTINATGALSTVVVGDGSASAAVDITAKNSVTYNGAELSANGADIKAGTGSTALTATLAGGIKDDAFTITGVATQTAITVTGAMGIGSNTLTVDGTAGTVVAGLTISVAGVTDASTTLSGSTAQKNTITGSAGVDTITGGDLKDTISGGAGNDTITGGKGADALTGGTGGDKFVMAKDSGVASTANTTTAAIAAGQTITFGNGLDVISDFVAGTDTLDVGTGGAAVTGIGLNEAAFTATKTVFLSGAYNATTGVFTIAADGAGADTLVLDTTDAGDQDIATADTFVMLVGVNSANLVAGSFV